MVGCLDHIRIVLDHNQRVPEIPQAGECPEETLGVALMQPDGRLIEHIDGSGEPSTELGRQANSLRFSATQRVCRTTQREVVESDVAQEAQLGLHVRQRLRRDGLIVIAQGESSKEVRGVRDRHRGELMDGLSSQRDSQQCWLEASAVADGAGHLLAEPVVAALPAIDGGENAGPSP